MNENNTISASMLADLTTATAPVIIPMANNYLFRALLQHNNRVLKALIRSLLHLKPEEVSSVVINNPIELGSSVDEKNSILDIKLTLNSGFVINLEMQVINEGNWVDRSTCYLCRTYSNLIPGSNYSDAKPVVQIGLLNFTLFPDSPEFYVTYKLLNEKNRTIYSDKLRWSVLNLTRTDLATEEDRLYEIDLWAAFFRATTWKELKCSLRTTVISRTPSPPSIS